MAKQGIQTPASILIKQICHKSFYKCPVGGYRGWWKYPIHAVSSPAGLKPRLLARLSVLTASDPLAICRVGCPVPRGLCVLTLRRFNTEAGQKKEEGKKSLYLVILVLVRSQHMRTNRTEKRLAEAEFQFMRSTTAAERMFGASSQ